MKAFLLLIGGLVIWFFLSMIEAFVGTIPNPIDVVVILFSSEIQSIAAALLITLKTVLVALIFSLITGYVLGIFCGFNKTLNSVLYPIFNSIKSVPITVFLPTFLVVFHLDYFIIPMICTPIIATICVNVSQSCQNISSSRMFMAQSLNISFISLFKHIIFWETLETLFSTLRIVLTYALTLEIALDYFLNHNRGIGAYINNWYQSYSENKYAPMYAGIIVASLVGIALIKLLDRLSKKYLAWKKAI